MSMYSPEVGAERGRSYLIREKRRREEAVNSAMAYTATVASVGSGTVTLEDEGGQALKYIGSTPSVGDDGIVIPLAGGGRVFAGFGG